MEPFEFKNFKLKHDKSPMPIGVDSMLLGAWAKAHSAQRILDIGCGCGILSVMCAQENRNCFITGIDISESAIEEAEYNRLNSPWPDQMEFKLADLKEYQPNTKIDYIISNPPFFNVGNLQNKDKETANARHQNELSIEDIFKFANEHLSDNGVLSMVLPYHQFELVQQMTSKYHFVFNRLTTVKPKEHKPVNRILVEIGKKAAPVSVDELIVRRLTDDYTQEYKQLTSKFYKEIA